MHGRTVRRVIALRESLSFGEFLVAVKATTRVVTRAEIHGHAVLLRFIWLVEHRARLVKLIVEICLFDERQQHHGPAKHFARLLIENGIGVGAVRECFLGDDSRRGEKFVGVGVTESGERDLLEMISALHSSRGFTSLLDGREQEGDKDANDGDGYEQLDECESELSCGAAASRPTGMARSAREPYWAGGVSRGSSSD